MISLKKRKFRVYFETQVADAENPQERESQTTFSKFNYVEGSTYFYLDYLLLVRIVKTRIASINRDIPGYNV
jgi:hypothetical protein